MSVATKNPFALLDDDEPQVAAVSTPAPAAAAAPTPAPAAAKRGRGANGNTGSRRGQYYKRGGAANSGAPNVGPDADGFKTGNPNAEAGGRFQRTEGRGDREGRGRGRGGRGRGGQRFDRHSQTGQVDSEKAVAQGWGAETGEAELKDEAAGASDAKVEAVADQSNESTPAADTPAAAEGEKQGEGRRRREEEEEEDNTLTLEEYLKQKKEKESAVPAKLEGRQAETGDWAGATPLVKDGEEDNYFIGKTKAAPKPRAKKEEKVIIEIDAHFERPQRDGGRGRGRGRGRGAPRGGRGGDRSSRPAAPAVVDVADESAFPSLGA